jgi:hypothetical protein
MTGPDQRQGQDQEGPVRDNAERSLLADLLERSRLYHTSQDYLDLLEFVGRLRNFAPFNALLLQIQKPGLAYAASEYDWRTRFNRTVKEHARPLLILWPFGPVALVYDVQDTEGDPLPEDVMQTFHATGPTDEAALKKAIDGLAKLGITVNQVDQGDAWAGGVKAVRRSKDKKERPDYRVSLNKNHDPDVRFVTLVHELGHLYLGHLGPDKFLGIEERSRIDLIQRELEAESLAWLVCKRRGITSKSESYLANFAKANTTVGDLDFYQLTKAAGQVETALGIAAHTLFEPKDERTAAGVGTLF